MASMSWAYVAGFFDGEGCVDCREKTREDRDFAHRRVFRLTFYQNTRDVLDRINLFLQGEGIEAVVRTHTRPDRVELGHSGSYMLAITGVANVFKCLNGMFPYLIVKEDEASFVIEWLFSLLEDAESGVLDGKGTAKATYLKLRKVV